MVHPRHSGSQADARLIDDPRLPVCLGVGVMLSSALWGWSFMVVIGVGLAVTAVAVVGWRHKARTMQRWALWLSLAALSGSLLARASLLTWESVETKQVSWIEAGEAGRGARAAVGQKRVELHFRLHPGYLHYVYSTPLVAALKGESATQPAVFGVARSIWGLEQVRVISVGSHKLCATVDCPAGAVPVAGGGSGWKDNKPGVSPWR